MSATAALVIPKWMLWLMVFGAVFSIVVQAAQEVYIKRLKRKIMILKQRKERGDA